MISLTRDVLEKIAFDLEGTCTSLETIIENYDLKIDSFELEDQLLNVNTEMCQGCNWWFECGDLVDDEGDNNGYCEDCRKEKFLNVKDYS